MSVPEGYTPPGANSPELPPLLEQLGANSASTRLRAAGEIYTYGCSLARQATKAWFGDADIAKCFAPIGSPSSLSSGLPEATVGIAVSPARFEWLRAANGSPRLADVPPDIDAQEFELYFAPGASLDVLTARDRDGEGAIARFLKCHGEGIQQVELATLNVGRVAELLQDRFGLKVIYPQARPGADGTSVNFLLVDFIATSGENKKLLIELVETRSRRR
jgi:hypothetical protein